MRAERKRTAGLTERERTVISISSFRDEGRTSVAMWVLGRRPPRPSSSQMRRGVQRLELQLIPARLARRGHVVCESR